MKRLVSNLLVIVCQLLLVGIFFWVAFCYNVRDIEYSSIIYNDNLYKIANSVSILFEDEEKLALVNPVSDEVFADLPAAVVDDVIVDDNVIDKDVDSETDEDNSYSPLVSINASKYTDNLEMGFEVTEGNKEYSLSDDEFNVVVAVVAGEFDKDLNDALAVVSVILNRCDSSIWSKWAGSNPYSQVTRQGQFEVYFTSNESLSYRKYMPGGSGYGSSKYEIAKQAVIDGLNGIRNNKYLGFRSWSSYNYSDNYVIYGGNRYGYN